MTLSSEGAFPIREFTNESYMNPSPKSSKYIGRDPIIGQREAQRRLQFMPAISDKSLKLIQELSVDGVNLLPRGSSAVNMCTQASDLDIAVMVKPGHRFTQQPELWRKYQEELAKVEGADFKIEPRLVVEDSTLARGMIFDSQITSQDKSLYKDIIEKFKLGQ